MCLVLFAILFFGANFLPLEVFFLLVGSSPSSSITLLLILTSTDASRGFSSPCSLIKYALMVVVLTGLSHPIYLLMVCVPLTITSLDTSVEVSTLCSTSIIEDSTSLSCDELFLANLSSINFFMPHLPKIVSRGSFVVASLLLPFLNVVMSFFKVSTYDPQSPRLWFGSSHQIYLITNPFSSSMGCEVYDFVFYIKTPFSTFNYHLMPLITSSRVPSSKVLPFEEVDGLEVVAKLYYFTSHTISYIWHYSYIVHQIVLLMFFAMKFMFNNIILTSLSCMCPCVTCHKGRISLCLHVYWNLQYHVATIHVTMFV